MSFIAKLQRARQILAQQGRLSTRALERELETSGDELDELVEELVDVQQVARREGKILIWTGGAATPPPDTGAASPRTTTATIRAAEQSETRKVISIIFADLMGSTALQERLDPESVNRVMDAYYQAVRVPVEAAGGTVVQLLGDGVLCAFGIPRIAEDDALRAVRAAVGIQQAFREFVQSQQSLTVSIGLRVAVNTGEVVVSDEHPAGIGDPLNVAARLQQEARDGQVLIGQATRRLVAEAVTLERAGTFALKGRAETVTAYRVLSLERPTGTTAAFVGRAEELARLTAVYETARDTPAARLAVLLGSPGLGKSRLIDEVGRRLADSAQLIAAHCDAAGGATFAPIAEALREWLGGNPLLAKEGPGEVGEAGEGVRSAIEAALTADSSTDPPADASAMVDRARIVAGISALLAGSPASPEETFFVIRRFLRALAKEKPVVLVIDDLQWAEPLLLDLVEHLIQWGSGVPLFVVVGARPELRERRSSLATVGGLVSDVVTLSGLDAGAAMRLAANVIGAADLPAAVAAKVLATSEGNPLFVSELVRMLVDEGAIEMRGNRWTVGANLAALEMPPTIHALLAARIERLQPEERTVLERASVVGRHFSRGAVAALLGRNGSALDARLEALRRTELIEPDTGWLLGEPVLRFHHVLIRDAAYRRLLKGTRAELHERLANWIEAQGQEASRTPEASGGRAEHDETIGRHLEQAHQLLGEIGPLDASAKRLGERAAQRLSAAGRRALERDDVPVAADLLGRAVDRLDHDDSARADLALDWCEALLSAGDVNAAADAIEELSRFATALSPPATGADRLRAWHTCFTGQLTVMTAPQELQTAADAVATAANEFTELDDAAGEAKAHFVHALALARLGKVGACEAALDRALAAARKAGDRRRANTVLAIAPLAALWGPSPVTRASGRCLDVVRVLRITQGAPAVEAVALSCQGVLEALRGRTEAAHRMIASGRKMVEELGIAQRLFETDVFAGFVAMLEGDASAAEPTLRGAYDGLRELGLGIDAARAAALLARALLAQDRSDEAEALSHESEALAGDDLKAAIAWRGVRAEALAKRGEHTEAIDLARAAVTIAASTDALLDHADARLALAAALRAAGRSAEADAEHRHAIDLWEAKGATLLAESARRRASPAARPVAAPAPRVAHAPRRRPVRPNFAIEEARRAEAAVAARDVQALESLYRHDVEIVDHQFGVEYGHDAIVERVRLTIEESADGAFRHEDLATLGDFVALCRLHSTASGSVVYDVPFGATEVTYLLVIEADDQGCARRIDIFGEDALRDAVVRLYERHAALLPEGAARTRAAATAQSMAVLRSANADLKLFAPVLAPDIEGIDHRHLSNWSLLGAPAYLDHLRALHQVADDVDFRWEDVLALAPGALLTRTLHRGTERVGRGPYERCFLSLFVVGADGHFTRAEWFDDDHEAEALARFAELVPGSVDGIGAGDEVSRIVRRRVRPNAASALMKGIEAGFAARDRNAIEALLADPLHTVEHPTGATYGREGQLESIDRMLRLPNLEIRRELLATLGDALCLVRRRVTASGTAGGRFDAAEYEVDHIVLSEVDDNGRLRLSEVFAGDRLGDAIHRLYERYAELLPEGPARERAATAARVMRMWLTPFDIDLDKALVDPGIEIVDHRNLGSWNAVGASAAKQHMTALHDVARGMVVRNEDILALETHAILARRLHSGTGRAGGGIYERQYYQLAALGPDGRLTRIEFFDVDREADAIARFEALTGVPSPPARRRVRANAATRSFDRSRAAIDARDADALAELFDESLTVVHHPTRASYGRRGMLATWRSTLRAERLEFRQEILASLGDTLALDRHVVTVEGLAEAHLAGFGASVFDQLWMLEVDERGRFIRTEIFALDRVGDAIARLYECYAEQQSDDAGRERAAGIARSLAAFNGPIDLDRLALTYDPSARIRDYRMLATWAAEGAVEILQHFRLQLDLASDFAARYDELLALAPDAFVARMTFFGTARDSGGAFENRICVLFTFGADGRLVDTDVFEPEGEGEALARFDALAARPREDEACPEPGRRASADSGVRRGNSPGASPSPAGRGFSNAASRLNERFARAWAERDWNTVSGAYVAGHHVDDRRRLMQMRLPDGDARAALRFLFDVPGSRWVVTPLATRGEHLVVSRYLFEGTAGADAGPIAIDYLALDQTDADGRFIETVLFDPDDLDAAYAELDRRYGAGDGRHDATWQQALRLSVALPHGDIDACRAMLAPGFRVRDHRKLSWGDTLRDADTFLQAQLALSELAPDWRYRIDHHRARGLVQLGQQAQVGTREGGPFENPFLIVGVYDKAGSVLGFDIYDVDQLDQARARFEELTGTKGSSAALDPVASCFSNAAVAAVTRGAGALAARDWEEFRALFADDFRNFDRRALFLVESGRDEWLAAFRPIVEMTSGAPKLDVLATRGDRLALVRMLWRGAGGDVGPSEIDWLLLIELGIDGRHRAVVTFDVDDEEAADAELERRWAESTEGAASPAAGCTRRFQKAFAERDWDACAALSAPDQVAVNHRLVGWGTLRGCAAWVPTLLALVELAPDTRFRLDHLRTCDRGFFWRCAWCGTRDGGAFETPFVLVCELDSDGLQRRFDLWDVEDLDKAWARFAELLDSKGRQTPFQNTACQAHEEVQRCFNARYLPGVEACLSSAFVFDDRRPMRPLSVGREGFLEQFRFLFEVPDSRFGSRLLATRGDRLALSSFTFEGRVGDGGGAAEWDEDLVLYEMDGEGRATSIVLFSPDDLAAAYAELDARYEAGEAARPSNNWLSIAGFVRAVERRDWDAVRALCRDDFVEQDHRGLAVLGGTEGADAWVANFRTLVDLAPDTVYRVHHLLEAERGYFVHGSWYGTREGGPYELQVNAVLELDDAGRFRRADIYDDAVADAAFARLAELGIPVPPTARESAGLDHARPTVAESNAAMRAMSSWFDAYDRAFETGSWDELRRGCHPGFVFDDRRRMALLRGSVDLMVASARERAAMGARPEWHPVGSFGDRVFVMRVLWVGGPPDGPFEIEYLGMVECDENGLLTAFVLFDLDDARAVQREAWARWAAIEPDAAAVLTPVGEALDAFNEKSAAKWRAAFADDLVVEDHRLAGMGRVEGADAYTESIVALWKLAPVTHADLGWRWPALDRHGAITVLRRTGTVPDGGGDFENEYLYLYVVAQGRIARVEMFEMDALDKALARFEELRPPMPGLPPAPGLRGTGGREDTLRIPPNAATRGMDRWVEASLAGDADAVVALLDPSYTLEDRRPLFRTVSDRNTEIAVHLSLLHEGGWQPARTLLATAGDRLALQRWLWTKGESDARSEIEFLEIDELGDSGRFVRSILFAPEDRADASRELIERYIATGTDGMPHGFFETMRAWNEHDLQRVRGSLSDDFVLDDHRLAGMGRLEGPDAYIESVAALFELIPDARTEFLYFVAMESHGRVSVNRTWGLNSEGGEVESFFVLLSRSRDGKMSYFELFEVEHLDHALARLADLRLGRTNAATRARDRQHHAFVARDWDAIRRLAAADFVLEDRGKRALVTGDVEAWIASMQFTSQPGWQPRSTLLGTFGDHIALDRVMWSGEPGGDAFELARIRVLEADANGHMRAVIMFDPEDRWPASYEAMVRFAAADGAECAGVLAASNAVNERRWDELRMACAPDFVCVDHRPLALLGTLDREQWVEAMKAIVGLSDGVTYAVYDVLVWNESGIVTAVARHGTVPEGGGDFEDGFLGFYQSADGRLVRLDLFAEDDTEGALACFEGLATPRSSC